jgi:molybdate transport system regulatory protein
MIDNKKYIIKSRIWICSDKGTFLGEGRIELLKKIDEYGSITKAAKEMKMSYKKAWELVNSMNLQSDNPIVTGRTGGKDGGGSKLSEVGKSIVLKYDQLIENTIIFLGKEIQNIEWK